MGEQREKDSGGPGMGFPSESEESSSLLQTAVSVLQSSYLDSTSQDSFQYSQATLVQNDVFLSELKAFAQAKEAAGYSHEELEETFAFLLFDNEDEAKEVCQTGLRVNSSSISTLGDPAKGVYISKYADCLHPRPWHHGKSGYIVICKLIKGKVKVVSENHTTSYTCPSPGYDCHIAVSRSSLPSKTNHGQAFAQGQYYVYEVSNGSTAERPRQICPYIIITCQYKEPKEMPISAVVNLPEPNHKVLYCSWRGQLSIQGQILCTIALRTPYSSTIPAQLPPSLDINYVMGLSDLKKKLPAAAFGKKNYIENEVCFQGIYFSLYEVEISNKDQYKMDQLVKTLKEKDLAIIKYLQDQGVLILLTSSALALDDGFDPREPINLLALFLFTSSRSLCLRAEKHNPKDEREGSDDGNILLKIASVLPGLRYALQKATSSSRGDTAGTNTNVRQYFQEYTKFNQNAKSTSGQSNEVPLSSLLPTTGAEWTNPFRKHSEQSFTQLQHYLSNPSNYTLEMSTALGRLTDAAQSVSYHSEADCKMDLSPSGPPGSVPPNIEIKARSENLAVGLDETGEGPTKDVTGASKLWVQQSRRKSSRTVVTSTRRKWSPLKMQMHPMGDSGRNRKTTKNKINMASSFPRRTGVVANSSEPMLKLANLQSPHKRKRGAEVLSAEFVHKTQSEPLQKGTSARTHPSWEIKRPKTQKNPDVKRVPVAEILKKPEKSKTVKSVTNGPWKPQAKKKGDSEQKEPSLLTSDVSSPHQAGDSQESESCPGKAADLGFHPKGNNYESHALNLLADLALGSCIPSFIPRDNEMVAVPSSPSSDPIKEQQHQRKHKSLRAASDHEYHRVEKLAKGATSPSRASPNHSFPPAEKTDLNRLASLPSEKNAGILSNMNITSHNSSTPHMLPPKPHVLPPRETQEAAELNKHSFISVEHSYASQMPRHSRKHAHPRGALHPGPAPSRNGSRQARAGPLVGKVLPFRHQQNSSHPQRSFQAVATRRRSRLLSSRLKDNFTKSHTVSVCGESIKVTCCWEAEYLFNLDSRYTNDALEKTVIRALHGPWDHGLPDDMEEMKLILHMWVALFYSKPSKLLSNTRKVVEHSNPKKYVSINSTGEFFELSDDGEDWFGLETCPADSRSDPDQTPSSSLDHSIHYQGPSHPEENLADSQTDADGTPGVVDSTVSSSSGELPCEEEEPSSTSCPESLLLAEFADESLAVKDRQPVGIPEKHVHDISTIIEEKQPKEGLLDATITPSPSDELSNVAKPSVAPHRGKPHSQAPNSCTTPWNDGCGEQQESRWAAGAGGCPNPPKDMESKEDAEHCMEIEESSRAASNRQQHVCDSLPLDSSLTSAEPHGTSDGDRKSQVPFGHPEEKGEEVKEGKKEEEDFEYASTVLGPADLVFSQSTGAHREHKHGKEKHAHLAHLKDFGVPGEGPVPILPALASPCSGRSMPALSDGNGTGLQGLPGEVAPSLDTLQKPWEALVSSGVDTNGSSLAHAASPAPVGLPCDRGLMLLLPSDLSPVCGAQPDSVTGSLGPARETFGDGLEPQDRDGAPSAGRWAPVGSKAAISAGPQALCSQELSQTLSPDSSYVCSMAPDGAEDPGAAPETQEATANIQSPSQSHLGGSSCFSQRCGGDICTDLTLLSSDEANQEWKTALAGGSEAGDNNNMYLGTEKCPKSNKTTTIMVANTLQKLETPLSHLLESEPSSLVAEEMAAMKEHPRKQQSSPDPVHRVSAPASPSQQVPLPHGGDTDLHHHTEQREKGPILCQHKKSCEQVGAAEVRVAARGRSGSLKLRCAEEVKSGNGSCQAEPVESSPPDVLMPCDPVLVPPPPHGHEEGGIQTGSVLGVHPEMHSPSVSLALDGALRSCFMGLLPPGTCSGCASPEGQEGSLGKEPIPSEDSEEGSIIPLASLPSLEEPLNEPQPVCNQGKHEAEGSNLFVDPHHASMEVGEGEVPTIPFPAQKELSRESLEFHDSEFISDVLPRAEQLFSKDTQVDLSSEDQFGTISSDSDQECFGGTSQSLLTVRGSYNRRSMDAAGIRTNCNSSRSSVCTEGPSEDWGSLDMEQDSSWAEGGWPISPGETSSGHIAPYVSFRDGRGIIKDYQNFMVTKRCQERVGNVQPAERHGRCAGMSLLGTGRGFKEVTQHTLDMECLSFHYKLKQILRSGQPHFSTSKSIFPQDFSPQGMSEMLPVPEAPMPPSPRSRSPLQVTILPLDLWLSRSQRGGRHGDTCTLCQDTLCPEGSRPRAQTSTWEHTGPLHLSKLSYSSELQGSQGDIALILDEYAELHRVMLGRAHVGSEDRGMVPVHVEATSEQAQASLPGRKAACEELIAELCSALRFRLRSLAKEASSHTTMFYLVETGEDPFFARVKTLMKKKGQVEMEPLSFCEGKHPDTARLLVIIRNEDISSHIHNVPCLLKLKHCPNVVFAGVDSPEDLTSHIYQELFHTGGFVVSDNEVLETVTLGQLKEVVEVLEKLNRSGRWKWFLHYKERKKLREDGRVDTDAHKKHLILSSCQGADLIEVLHFHACDSVASPSSEHLRCLLSLQVQHIGARFAVYLTEKPSCSREDLESRGILVADVSTFLRTLQEVAAPFRQSYW